MNILIDTHALIWYLNGDAQLSAKANTILKNGEYARYVSKTTLWEIAIKFNLGKLQLNCPLSEIPNFLQTNGFQLLLISYNHILTVSALPLFHRDPFDRMLVAQALTENLTVVTKDPNFPLYGVEVVW